MATQSDLFGASVDGPSAEGGVAGLSAWDGVVTSGEEAALIAAIDACALSPFRFQGWEGKRLTASFGWRYDFDTGAFGPTEPMPDWLLPVRDRAAALAGLAVDALVQALVIRYDPGAGIGWHRDRPQFEHVIGLSLGSAATLRLRRRTAAGRSGFARASAPLTPRGLYHLTGDVRQLWEHSIAPGDVPRWSITFRSLSETGRRAA
ncbi:alpha-ketoglutarate-dependent dioxygenase AlkB [Sphingomonas montanisoli]|uniref:Alpha-ketoglutarate-dependent dioxygenase AlkB n=1 Tax=Sphingomonas montanisoli TaxID=2606412 RepID=A0A5D9C1M7_9SPHN|nr:alpha-ketoglutarate-dependent dioxygenase AlkB [Sphingomonas montanisoli]TZG25768.1 alpha-ketoglutarate-dependent dioxygenase AlkB [Sphingomonas montanisoli]